MDIQGLELKGVVVVWLQEGFGFRALFNHQYSLGKGENGEGEYGEG